MKIRLGLVSNSSSSSFIIKKDKIHEYQLPAIEHHIEISKILDRRSEPGDNTYNADTDDAWEISYDEDSVEFYTRMDNFDMYHYLVSFVGVDPDDIIFK